MFPLFTVSNSPAFPHIGSLACTVADDSCIDNVSVIPHVHDTHVIPKGDNTHVLVVSPPACVSHDICISNDTTHTSNGTPRVILMSL